ncbi:MAG: chromate transporter [Planctomycetota bacterium]|nr:MAG: chromate transporter [Planctomycetota bacterium]
MNVNSANTMRPRRENLRELAAVFLKLGATAFGGPAAHIAMMEDEVVTRRAWITREEFLDLLSATNLIPGPNSTEMAIHIGQRRAGFSGLLVAGASFIFPAVFLVTLIAWAYVRFGTLPQVSAFLYAMKPVILVIVLQAMWRLARSALKDRTCVAVAVVATACGLAGINELLKLALAGLFVPLARNVLPSRLPPATPCLLLATSTTAPASAALALGAATPFGLWPLFLFFIKVGSVLFGSGYVLLAFIRADLVEHWGWLSESQLLDAIAVGQVTPGPVFTTATFIGYVLGGSPGAAVATVGIFLPAFFFVAVSGPLVPRLRSSKFASAALDGVNVGSVALIAAVTWQLGSVALCDVPTVLIALVSACLLWRYALNSAWLVIGAGILGAACSLLR